MKKYACCEFRKIEMEQDRTELLKKMYYECCWLITQDKELWVQNRVAFIQYKVCDKCKARIKSYLFAKLKEYGMRGNEAGKELFSIFHSMETKIKWWYPSFIVKWMLNRAIKKANNGNNPTDES